MQSVREQNLVRLTADSAELKRDLIYERLLHDIICRRIAAGSRIDEALIAERDAAGRAGVRDALYRLSLEGRVTRRPRPGTFVTELSVFELQQAFELRVQLEGQ
ncbi:MAG: GntR family transcriptional regulator [Gammaproteobacteria bacterium]|nr:GntR family transcriptional regulator [Gammaproteobacteria bacterium]NIR84400.1 GntR family transcriptional regulator [Gammaproteobacteria bacterium]NIR90881.1 GntR family transcriptional regulator [Gammaproteobacteria bacterium]NIU07067.1 GntR family transcriptional regulator [Gammaproteobacteria bacterium]NIV76196.1 GntR family transcriptional regulator [Gammaproteobacteria bacterium]